MFKNKWLLTISIVAVALRLIGLSTHPVGFTPDEASFGFDAYSIMQTGRDQWDQWIPITLKSFGDYKMPLYTYLSMPSIAIFGLNVFATRLPNAVFGILAVYATYFFVKELFKNEKLALLSALMLAISPWHVALSRGAFEANLTSFFMPISLYFLLKAKDNPKYYLASFLALGINLFSYHTARIASLPVYVLAVLIFSTNLVKSYRDSKKYLPVLFVLLGLAVFSLFTGGGQRLATSNIFSLSENVFSERVAYINAGQPEVMTKIMHTKYAYVANIFLNKYLEYFSPQFLFLEGAREATYGMIPGVGVLYMFEIFSVLYAAYYFLKSFDNKTSFLIVWILISAFPAALSLGPGLAANRAAFMMPALQIFSAIGLLQIYKALSKYFSKKHIFLVFILVITLSTLKFIELQWYVQPVRGAKAMFASTQEAIQYVDSISDQYDRVIIDKSLSEAHMFLAFYTKLDPTEFQKSSKNWKFEQAKLSWVDQLPEYEMGKYIFRNIDWQRDLRVEHALILYRGKSIPDIVTPIKTFYRPDGKPAYFVLDTRVNVFASR